MGSGDLGKFLNPVNVAKALKPPTSKKDLVSIYKNTKEINVGRGIAGALTGSDAIEQKLYGNQEAKDQANKDADTYAAQQAADALKAQNDAADATNQQNILSKKRRKASSVLSKAGSGLTDSVLGSAATYSKTALGA